MGAGGCGRGRECRRSCAISPGHGVPLFRTIARNSDRFSVLSCTSYFVSPSDHPQHGANLCD